VTPPRTLTLATILGLLALALGGCDSARQEAPPPPPVVSSAKPVAAAPVASAPAAAAPSAEEAEPVVEAEPTSIAAQHVLVAYRGAKGAPRDVKRTKAEARKLAEEILAKARAGTEFAKLAEQYSDDPGSKTNLGNLGKFTKDKMVPEFAGPAFKLREGEISDVVETPFGFHVIKRNQ